MPCSQPPLPPLYHPPPSTHNRTTTRRQRTHCTPSPSIDFHTNFIWWGGGSLSQYAPTNVLRDAEQRCDELACRPSDCRLHTVRPYLTALWEGQLESTPHHNPRPPPPTPATRLDSTLPTIYAALHTHPSFSLPVVGWARGEGGGGVGWGLGSELTACVIRFALTSPHHLG